MDVKDIASTLILAQNLLKNVGFAPSGGMNSPRISIKLGYYGIAAIILAVLSAILCLSGLYLYLSTIMPNYQVLLIMGSVIGGVALVIFGVRFWIFYCLQRKLKNSAKELGQDLKDIIGSIANGISDGIEKPITDNPKSSIVIALLAGFILGKKLFDE